MSDKTVFFSIIVLIHEGELLLNIIFMYRSSVLHERVEKSNSSQQAGSGVAMVWILLPMSEKRECKH